MKHLVLLPILLLISIASYSAEKVKGKIIFEKASMDVTFLVPVGLFGNGPDFQAMQKGIRYIDATGKKHRLKPGMAKEFTFFYGTNPDPVRMVFQPWGGGMFSKGAYMLQVIDGKVKMFEYTVTTRTASGPNGVGGTTTTTTHYLLQKNQERLFEPRFLGFKKDMARYFGDCPKLVAMIESKEFKRRDFDEIVLFYNNNCN